MQTETTARSWDFDTFLTWLYENRKGVGITVGVAVLAMAGFGFYSWKKENNETEANAALFALPPLLGPGKTVQVHSEDFQKVASEYPDTQAGERAELLGAGVLFTDGKYAEAQRQFSKFIEAHEGSKLQAQAALGVAASLEAQGKVNEAVAKYQEAIARFPGENIVSPAKLTLARLLEEQNRPADALKFYDDLARIPNPYDPWVAEAGERREQLLEKTSRVEKETSSCDHGCYADQFIFLTARNDIRSFQQFTFVSKTPGNFNQ